MFLKKIEIIGFKSFAQKTVLDFSGSQDLKGKKNSITAIVGPNGSGKSNIVDALRWTLGEQSMKNLRGKKSLDVIFAGSDKKARLGSAQVTLFLDNSTGKLAVDFPEVKIARRIYRSGESEYLINGSQARLLDVIDLLARVGIGQHSYCLVNQGMADRILNASPLERRSIIEEAAGVKEFQLKKQRSERKLRATKQNLERVAGLLLEIEPHLKNLKKQNQKLENSRIYRDKLMQKRQELFGFLFFDLEEKLEKLKKKELEVIKKNSELEALVSLENKKTGTKEIRKKNFREEIFRLEEKLRHKQNQISAWERDIFLLEGRIALEKEKIKSFNLAEIVPVDLVFVEENLRKIQKIYQSFLEKLRKIKNWEELASLKIMAQKVAQELATLAQNVASGQVEKKKPKEKLQLLVQESREKIEKIFQEKKVLEEKKRKLSQTIILEKEEVARLIVEEQTALEKKQIEEQQWRERIVFLERSREELNQIKIELARLETRKEDLLKRVLLETGWTEKELLTFKKMVGPVLDVNRAETEIARLRFLVDQSGAVDESVVEEYKEAKIRFDFLTKEAEDLKKAMTNLKAITKEMDQKIRLRFEEAFGFIDKKFQEYFNTIFGGGRAGLKLIKIKTGDFSSAVVEDLETETTDNLKVAENEEEKDETQWGVEILAVPQGKKITSLGMLSGGERALTSLALLFAVIAHNPPPFAILDEVEAALDEANSARFNRIIRSLSQKTQFILITHNRQTMREAGLLYGVTMSDDGVSKLLSVRLDQVGEAGEIKK